SRLERGQRLIAPSDGSRIGDSAAFNVKIELARAITIDDRLVGGFELVHIGAGLGSLRSVCTAKGNDHIPTGRPHTTYQTLNGCAIPEPALNDRTNSAPNRTTTPVADNECQSEYLDSRLLLNGEKLLGSVKAHIDVGSERLRRGS